MTINKLVDWMLWYPESNFNIETSEDTKVKVFTLTVIKSGTRRRFYYQFSIGSEYNLDVWLDRAMSQIEKEVSSCE